MIHPNAGHLPWQRSAPSSRTAAPSATQHPDPAPWLLQRVPTGATVLAVRALPGQATQALSARRCTVDLACASHADARQFRSACRRVTVGDALTETFVERYRGAYDCVLVLAPPDDFAAALAELTAAAMLLGHDGRLLLSLGPAWTPRLVPELVARAGLRVRRTEHNSPLVPPRAARLAGPLLRAAPRLMAAHVRLECARARVIVPGQR